MLINQTKLNSLYIFIHTNFRVLIFIILLLAGTSLSAATALTTERVASGLNNPVYICSPEEDNRLFIVEQMSGRIKILVGGSILANPFLDIGSKITAGGERGLLGMAFHPDYAVNGYFYVNYTRSSDAATVISRFTVSGDPDLADVFSEQIVLVQNQPFANHNGGMLAFGPNDGYLYIGLGDGGSSGDPMNKAQSDTTLLGKMLRIDIDSGTPYAIPGDNPFIGSPGILDEIWAKGVRNPWRYSFDRVTGNLYIGDVGQNNIEEIDFQPNTGSGGENYGWRCYEGNDPFNTAGCGPAVDYDFPIYDYNHSGGNCSVTGGYVYRGCAIADLEGTYFFADFCTGRIWSFRYDGVSMSEFQERTAELAPGGGMSITNISSFGEDENGEIYIIDYLDGEIYKIIPDGTPSLCFLCGDINSSGSVNILDLTFLIAYLYKNGPAPDSPESADVNGSGSLNILDVTYLIMYLYKSGPAPVC